MFTLLLASRTYYQSSGIAVDEECLAAFQDLKLHRKFRYVVYCLGNENRKIVVEKSAAPDATFKNFVAELPEDDCRYAVYDFEYEKSPGEGMRSKICFIVWYVFVYLFMDIVLITMWFRAPDTAKIKQKMLYAASKDALRKTLVGISTEIQATDASEIAYEAVLDKVLSI